MLCQSECNAILMSQDARGKVSIVPPFIEENLSGCEAAYRKPGEKKISELARSKSSLLGDVLSWRNHGARLEASAETVLLRGPFGI